MNFEAAVDYLLSLGHETLAIKLGLRNTELLLNALDNPERVFQSVQIAGTNGKGSTAAMLDSICRAAGIKTGLYTSPHLVSITERIKISGTEITREDFAACATTVREVSEQLEALPTFFEQVTAIACSLSVRRTSSSPFSKPVWAADSTPPPPPTHTSSHHTDRNGPSGLSRPHDC